MLDIVVFQITVLSVQKREFKHIAVQFCLCNLKLLNLKINYWTVDMLHSGSFTLLSSKGPSTSNQVLQCQSLGAYECIHLKGRRGHQNRSNRDQQWCLALRGRYKKICNAFSIDRLCQMEEKSTFQELAALWSTTASLPR